jgi:hypothetical protein
VSIEVSSSVGSPTVLGFITHEDTSNLDFWHVP